MPSTILVESSDRHVNSSRERNAEAPRSGCSSPRSQGAYQGEADDYLSKPFSARELLARVATHIELARARRHAAESALKDVFLGIVAHELWTPLTSVKLRVQMARRKLDDSRAGSIAAQHLSRVERPLARMEELVDTLLTVSAIQANTLRLSQERADLGAICREAVGEESAVDQREVRLTLSDGPVDAFVDRRRIGEVVRQLVRNALMYSPRDRPVALTLCDQDTQVVIAVQDEGPGIPRDEVARIFDRFYQVPGIQVQVGSRIGFGLGLFVAKGVVERHGGQIAVDSSVGRGSTFVVTLPRGQELSANDGGPRRSRRHDDNVLGDMS